MLFWNVRPQSVNRNGVIDQREVLQFRPDVHPPELPVSDTAIQIVRKAGCRHLPSSC
jgi:hypothetical protein